METQENTYEKAEELVSSKKGKIKGSSLSYTTNLNTSEAQLVSDKKKSDIKSQAAAAASPKSEEEDIFVKDQFEMIKSLRKVIH